MTDTSSAFDENSKPICHGSPRSLLELASIKMALNIWLQKFNEFYPAGINSYLEITEFHFHYEESIAVPRKIKKIIDSGMYPIANELNKLVRYINTGTMNLSYVQIYSRLNLVSFGGNGTIHFKDTIANFLEDDSLNILTRFEIACVNCVEEKIDFFWPLMSSTLSLDNFRFDDNFMLYYWICRKKGELRRIPLKGFSCIGRVMIDKCCENFIHLAVEYFLALLDPDDRLVELDRLANTGDGNILHLFPNFDGPTQRHILDKYPTSILYHFVIGLKPIDYAVQCFIYISDTITPKYYCNEVIICFIRYIIGHRDIAVSEKRQSFWHRQIDIALEQIWLNTPSHLKEYTLENFSIVLNEYNEYYVYRLLHFGRSIRFLLALLSDVDVHLRSQAWMNYWPQWINDVAPSQFEELMELCLMKTEAIKEFKSIFPYTEKFLRYCDSLIYGGYFAELDEFLSYLFSNHDRVLNIKKHILTNETIIFSQEREAIEKYAKYFDDSFSNNLLAANFKDNVISSDSVLQVLFDHLATGWKNLHDVKFIVSLFASPQNQPEIKKKFLQMFRDKITNGELDLFNQSVWSNFLMWCLDSDEKRLDEFMKSLQIDVVFHSGLLQCMKYYGNNVFRGMDKCFGLKLFVMWYFKSEYMFENFIRQRIEYYEKMDAAEVETIFGKDNQSFVDFMKDHLFNNYFW